MEDYYLYIEYVYGSVESDLVELKYLENSELWLFHINQISPVIYHVKSFSIYKKRKWFKWFRGDEKIHEFIVPVNKLKDYVDKFMLQHIRENKLKKILK